MDAQMLKAQKRASSFGMNVKFVRSVLLGPSTTNHDNNPQRGCVCYYCKKHWQKMGGPPCYKRPRYVKYRTGALRPNLASALQMSVRVQMSGVPSDALFDQCGGKLLLSDFNSVLITLLFQCCPSIVWPRALDSMRSCDTIILDLFSRCSQ